MNLFVLNLLIAGIWLLLSKEPSLSVFIIGFIIGFIMIAILKPVFSDTVYIKKKFFKNSDYIRRTLAFCYFVFWFLIEFLKANFKIAWAVMTRPNAKIIPHIFTVDVTDLTTFEIMVLTQCITLTPGTTSIEVTEDQNTLYVHAFDGKETLSEKQAIENGLLKQIQKFSR